MDELTKFSRFIKSQIQDNESLDINDAREIKCRFIIFFVTLIHDAKVVINL